MNLIIIILSHTPIHLARIGGYLCAAVDYDTDEDDDTPVHYTNGNDFQEIYVFQNSEMFYPEIYYPTAAVGLSFTIISHFCTGK